MLFKVYEEIMDKEFELSGCFDKLMQDIIFSLPGCNYVSVYTDDGKILVDKFYVENLG